MINVLFYVKIVRREPFLELCDFNDFLITRHNFFNRFLINVNFICQFLKGELQMRGAAPNRDWTDQETLLLLEGLEMFKDDWNKVYNLWTCGKGEGCYQLGV